MFEKMSRSRKYDSNIFSSTKTYIYRPVASKFWLVRPGSGCGLWLINFPVVTYCMYHETLYSIVQSILSNSPPVGKGSLGGLLVRMDY